MSQLRTLPATAPASGIAVAATLLTALSWLACGPSTETPAPLSPGSLLITGVLIVDPATDTVSAPQDVLIVDGQIQAVVPAGDSQPARAATVLSFEGRYALPGLIDVHAHIGDGGLDTQTEEVRRVALAQFVRYGVTTIFAPGGGGGNDHDLARWKERCGSGELLCPGLYGSGALITAPGSHPIGTLWNLPIDVDPEVVYQRGAVAVAEDEPVGPLLDRKVALGVDAIKIVIEDGIGPVYPMPRLSKAKVAELVKAGHERGLRVFAHVSRPSHVEDGVAAGVDGVMHSAEEPLADDLLAQMAERGIYYVATLALYDGLFDRTASRFEDDPFALAGVSQQALASLRQESPLPFQAEDVAAITIALRDNLRRAAAAGVPLALGSDVNNPTVFPGYSAHEELALMADALTPAEALAAATLGGAAFLQRETSLGRIEAGYEADLLILSENPLEDVLHSRSLEAVISDGRIVEGSVSVQPSP